ncbi:TetR/AcrR family transcriptional regulator [Flexivirga oryzae]|uniref:AcrR family transcriptional regulator n=1 Tax=Flexivirga oryzae TaxID=1794944 RepID=A0A839N563_9MICO|nr:TetR/AcrR family transcriptional regulator [Flexivirga oryzae]MBB2892890.1 AcrR family transcriptional regulator [Flexivirga oryzae]
MAKQVKRRYSSAQRAQQAAETRRAVLVAARELFEEKGYVAVGVGEVARRAGVNLDTVYRAVGRKPQLLLAAIDQILGSSDQPVPAEQRDYVIAVRAAATAGEKLRTYADALGTLMPRAAPLFAALREAAPADPECAALDRHISERRAANMRLLAAELRTAGQVREELDDDRVADLIWSTNSPQWFDLVTSRGWSAAEYADALYDLWSRVLLTSP